MQDLRLGGVQENGEYLILNGASDQVFRLKIDEALRAATSRQFATTLRTQSKAPELTPKSIQAKLRSGMSAEAIAQETGASLEHIRKYESPILAERQNVATQARKVTIGAFAPRHESYWKAFGDGPVTLGELTEFELTSQGIQANAAVWDAWKNEDGTWTVELSFSVRDEENQDKHKVQTAQWSYKLATNELTPLDLLADDLSAMESDVRQGSRQSHEAVFDFEQGQPEQEATEEPQLPTGSDLLEVLRNRRGQRLGLDENADEALATLLAHPALPSQDSQPNPLPASDHQNSQSAARSAIAQKYPNLFTDTPAHHSVPEFTPGANCKTGATGKSGSTGEQKTPTSQLPVVQREETSVSAEEPSNVLSFQDRKKQKDGKTHHPATVTGEIKIPTDAKINTDQGNLLSSKPQGLASAIPGIDDQLQTGSQPVVSKNSDTKETAHHAPTPSSAHNSSNSVTAQSTQDSSDSEQDQSVTPDQTVTNEKKKPKKRSKVPSWDDIVFGPK